jgi:hypothetical protein
VGLKVAIVGLSDSSRNDAPWKKDGWELWGLAWDSERYWFDRAFEMHDMETMKSAKASIYQDLPGYFEKIQHCRKLYMPEAYKEVPGCERYPYEWVGTICGRYWESSIAYMVSLAIAQGASDIAIYGVDMKANEEYAYQRPNMEYLIGLARGRGVKVHIPESSPLLKFSGFDGYHGKYGWRG